MPDEQKRKTKRKLFRRVSKLFIYRFWLSKGSPDRQVPRRSAVFDDSDLFYVKSYEHIHDYYIKRLNGKKPLVKLHEAMIYNDIMLHLKRGTWFTIKEYAQDRAIHEEKVIEAIDNLENVNLVHRERSRDGSEHTVIIVPHTPLPLDQLRRRHADILRRRENKFVQNRKKEAGRNRRDWMPQAFSWKTLLESFGGSESKAERFEDIVSDLVHRHLTDRQYSRRQFIMDVEEACEKHKLRIDERHHNIAFEIKDYIQRIV